MLTKEISVDFNGLVLARDGLRVIADRFEKGKHFILLGAGSDIAKISFDRRFPPLVQDVSHPSDTLKNLRIFSAVVKEINPATVGARSFTVLASPRMNEADGEDVLFRVLMKHPKTPPLIYRCDLSDKTTVVAEGAVRDFDGTVYTDRLLILPKGEQLRLTTKAGEWLVVNHGAGVVQVVQVRRGLGESPLKKALDKKLAEGQLGKPVGKTEKPRTKAKLPIVVGQSNNQAVLPENQVTAAIGMMSMDWESEGFGTVFSGQ
jgi:hypothetical protein